MAGLRLLGVLCAALGVAFVLSAATCLLPENAYQRWQLQPIMNDRLRWIYERIHFDPRPIDIAIIGPSRVQLGLSAPAIEEKLAQNGSHASVANLAFPGAGRDIQWAIVQELFKTKSPKAIILEVEAQPYPFGSFAFKYVAPAKEIVFPPTPFLHNYLYNIAYLPIRNLTLFGADLFPDLFGLSKQFDPERYAQSRTDYSTSFIGDLGKLVDMEHPVPRATLLAETRTTDHDTVLGRAMTRINGGEDHLYMRKIAAEAKARGAQVIFVFLARVQRRPIDQRYRFPQTVRSGPQLWRPGAAGRIVRELVASQSCRGDDGERPARRCDPRPRPLKPRPTKREPK